MSRLCFVAPDGLQSFLEFLSQNAERLLVPVEKPAAAKPSVVFEKWNKGNSFTLQKATVPPKEAVLPECETIMTFRKVTRPDASGQQDLSLQEADNSCETIVFGCRPCDARGFSALDKPYLEGLFADPYYRKKREKLTVITHTCSTGCETCFCHWVGGGPSSPDGSDILMTEISGGYALQAVTPKGEKLLEKSGLADAAEKMGELMAARRKTWQSLVPAPKLDKAPESLKKVFANGDFWTIWTDRCISCGACTYFCPTCYCFNLTDEGEPDSEAGGRRLRSWDNCMSALYTREASGHNPRPRKSERMRNRVSHKFWTFFENWGSYLCSGCGRCITNCPVHLDIRAITLAAIEEAEKGETKKDQ